ncbi:MAG: hypothetical protein IJJ56_08170 [Prevotella sp.]|nr:hypothetical protein [Prevotella sp.]
MTKDRNYTFMKPLRAVLVVSLAMLTTTTAMAQGVVVNGNVYGGGNKADVKVNTEVNISAGTVRGNVFGGGKGTADSFECEKAMVGDEEDPGVDESGNLKDGGTKVTISNGTVNGTVYGGGEVGRVERNTEVTIGDESGTGTPVIKGNVFGGGAGVMTHGYSALVRGKATVTVQGKAKVEKSVYGGGEIASVGRYKVKKAPNVPEDAPDWVPVGMPYSLKNENNGSGNCTVKIKGQAEIGPNGLKMKGTTSGKPDDTGHVFGAGKGVLPGIYSYADTAHMPKRMMRRDSYKPTTTTPLPTYWMSVYEDDDTYIWEYFDTEAKYLTFIETMALATQGKVTIGNDAATDKPFVKGSVYGGSENGHVQHDTYVEIKSGQIGCGKDATDPYGDNVWSSTTPPATDLACASWDYDFADYTTGGAPYDPFATDAGTYDYSEYSDIPETVLERLASTEGGKPEGKDGHTYFGNVFGGGSGVVPYAPGKWHRAAGSVGGNTQVDITGGHILTCVYGGNEQTDVGKYTEDADSALTIPVENTGKCTINMSGGTVGVPRTKEMILRNPANGHIYGAGMGDKRIFFNTWTNVSETSVNVTGGTVYGSVYGGGQDGHVIGDAVTTIRQDSDDKPTVIGCDGTSGYDGNVFGGGQGSITALTAGVVGGNVDLKIQGGTMNGSVYGGGRIASVGTYFAMATNRKYGWMQDGDDHGCISLDLTGGTIGQNVYGGCMGTTDNAELRDSLGKSKNVILHLNKGVKDNEKGCVVKKDIFGCNNVFGSPVGSDTVHIHGTQNASKSEITDKVKANSTTDFSQYDVRAVYGGGNLAAYTPTDADSDDETKQANAHTTVIIDGCGRTSIGQVYGGGNAASTPATEVTINGTYEIGELFGGGNGYDKLPDGSDNPGANVGYTAYGTEYDPPASSKEERTTKFGYGSGKAAVNIYGGLVHIVFGGSNTKGNVRQSAVTMLEDMSTCDFCVDEAYGGGKSAPMDAEAVLHMACIPGLSVAYGGAEAADIMGNVTLNITNGTFDRVFGGNNMSGTINGSITVNIEEKGCRPVIIGQLYGGGNQAGYSIYGYKKDSQTGKQVPIESANDPEAQSVAYDDPVVNIKSFTSIGDVYGGGLGETAVMVGSPTVNINVVEGKFASDNQSVIGDEKAVLNGVLVNKEESGYPTGSYPVPSHASGKIGVINNVFGGGNAAKVIGSTNVKIGTEDVYVVKTVEVGASVAGLYTLNGTAYTAAATDNAEEGVTYYEKKEVGADIRGNVYGGGNQAEVTGDTNVNVGRKVE